ncbi:MAG: ATP-binding protein [Campylobacterota bacterium]|nr:ATP-binding protein [Campylobacterota bacterium]
MHKLEIDTLLKNFNISKNELDSRGLLKEFSSSLSSTIVEEFVQKYLVTNSNLSVYLAHIDTARLLKNMKEFISIIFTAPVDEDYIAKIYHVSSIQFTIKLEPSKVSYGFYCIDEIINKLADINEIVREHKIIMSKILRFVEHVMNDGYYTEREKEYQKSIDKLQGFSIENELYIGLNIHKLNLEKLQLVVSSSKNNNLLEEINELSSNCKFGKFLNTLKFDKKYNKLLEFDLQKVIELHDSWHIEFVKLKNIIINNEEGDVDTLINYIERLTEQINQIIECVLNKSLDDGKIALDSGIRSMKKMTNMLSTKKTSRDFDKTLEGLSRDVFSNFSWAIEDFKIVYDKQLDDDFDIINTIRYESKNANIGIKLKKEYTSKYIQEMINMLLEVLELHFIIKDREESLLAFADKSQSANKAKDVFLANMSHELRTPLNAVNGFSQILMKKKDVPKSVKLYIEKINMAGKNLLDLVNTILDFAKLEAGKMQFTPKLSNISNVLSEVNTLIEPLALKKNINYHMAKIVSLNLFIDTKLFKQVLINLLTNGIKFTNNGGKVEVSLEFNYDKHVYIFTIKDNGIGISKEGIAKLFQPFSQVDDSYKKQEQGTGLGLMISKKIIEDLHKGKIWVESTEGKGSSFYIELPTPMIQSKTYIVNEAPASAKNILIAEDSPEYQNILIENLKETHNITITDSVNKVKNLIKRNKYDYLILDFFLLDGISSEILEFMEDEDINIQTIVMSAEDEIHISSSLAGFSNLEGIMNKTNIEAICNMLISGIYDDMS